MENNTCPTKSNISCQLSKELSGGLLSRILPEESITTQRSIKLQAISSKNIILLKYIKAIIKLRLLSNVLEDK